ncbi:hypothetical protein BGZ73_000265 [Actinomortierella ambigua]|nr:hypothetical protein BGZ73_000265 [Actinomortierella ambigua]
MDWLTRDTQLLENALIGCKVPYVRQAVAQLVLACLGHLRRTEPAQYGLREVESRSASTPLSAAAAEAGADGEETETTREPMVETRTICEEGTPIYQLVEMLGGLLGEARKYWQHFDEYFSLLHNIALLGQEERAMMVQQGLLTQLIEFFIGDDRHDSKKKKMMDKFSKPSFHYVLLTIQALLLTCDVIRSMELITGAAVNARAAAASHLRRSSTASNQSTSSSASPEESAAGHSMSDTDSSVTDGRVVFTSADLAAMIYVPPATMGKERAPVFFAKMIQDRTETEIVATISRHLSAHGPLGQRVLEYVSACMDHMNEEQVPTVLQIYKELIQIEDEQTEMRSEVILQRTVKVLSLSSSPATAFDCLEFLRAISDFGQCGRWVQHWLLANKSAWVQEMLVVHGDQETRAQTQQFLKELLSSERVFHPEWSEAQVAEAMARHFHDVLECMRIIPSILPYYQHQQQQRSPTSPSSPVEDEGLWRFVEYFQTLSEMVVSDRERALFNPCWPTFIECLLQVDARHLTLDYDKKEMMILWGKLMNDDASRNLKLSQFKQIGQLLRHYFVCLQPNPQNVSFHWETLPIYFDLVWRFCQVSPQFHLEWAQCHNYKWAIGAMIWGTFREHCPEVLPRLLRFTLTEFPVYREECWKSLPAPSTPHFATSFVLLARAMFAPHNEMAGRLFYRNNGLTWLTKIMKLADTAGNVLDPKEFYAVEALSVLHDYLIKIPECLSKPYFAEAFDHWQNLEDAIMLLTGNLMWNIERSVYEQSVAIVHQIVRVGSPTQSAPIVAALDGAHVEWRNRYDAGLYGPPQIYELFGGTLSPFYRSGALAGPEITPGVNFPPVRLGPSVFVPTVLVQTERRKKRRSEEDVEEGEQETALETVLRQWYEPYWALVKDACKLDGTKELNSKSVELAALVSMEQISIGQSSMLSVLCDAARLAKTDSDLQLALQNPYVTLLMERLVGLDGRSSEEKATASSAAQDGGVAQDGEAKEEGDDSEPVLRGLSESLLAQCDDLVRATIENLDRQALVEIVEQATDQAHQALARIVQQHEASAKEGKGMEEVEESTVLASTESERAMVVRSESRRLAKALRVLRLLSAASTIVMDEAAVTKWQQLMFSVLNHLQELSAESRTVIVPILNSSGPVPPCSTATTTQSQATGRRSGEDVQQQQQQHGRGASEGSLNAMTERENSRMEDGESGTEMEALEVGHASVPENRNEGGGGSTGGSDGSNEDEEDEDERRARMMSLEKEDDS